MPKTEIPLMVPCGDDSGAHAAYPWYGPAFVPGDTPTPPAGDYTKALHIAASGNFNDSTTLTHELGHYLGLHHVWEIPTAVSPTDNVQGPLAAMYDLLYGADHNGSFVRTFTSPQDLENFRAVSTNKILSRQNPYFNLTGNPNFGARWVLGSTTCETTVWWPGYPSSDQNVRTGRDDAAMAPWSPNFGASPYGVNIMDLSYSNDPACIRSGMSPMQIQKVRDFLFRLPNGDRNVLGRPDNPLAPGKSSNSFHGELDFDGDGLFDPAYWKESDQSCRYVSSANGAEYTIPLPFGSPSLGPTPAPADYDGDGKTDCAIYVQQTKTFYWRRSSDGIAKTDTFTLSGRSFVPLYNTYWLSSSGEARRYGLYDYKTATFYWKSAWGGTIVSKQYGARGDRLLIGHWDTDAYTDIAVWRPSIGLFSLTTSGGGYGDSHDIIPAGVQSTDIPVPNVDRDGDGRLDIAFWRPSTGYWGTIYNPASIVGYQAGYALSDWTQWGCGSCDDRPLSGFDFDADGKTDPAVHRPPSTVSGAGAFYIKTTTAPGSISASHGASGDVPFLSRHRYGLPSDNKPSLWIFRPQSMTWFERNASGGYPTSYPLVFGGPIAGTPCPNGDCIQL